MLIFKSVEELATYEGKELGVSNWLCVDQGRINAFAKVTDDYQWIHLDPERAADTVYGRPIAHGYLILSLIPALGDQIYRLENIDYALNAGLNWMRFPHAVTEGSHIRARLKVMQVQRRRNGPARILVHALVEIKETGKIACEAEMVFIVA
jgi:acyl dehydratase